MKKIKLTFERGGSLTVNFTGNAPKTVESILQSLPFENDLVHSRYCGREVCFGIRTKTLPPPEHQASRVKKFDVAYWRNWNEPEKGLPGSPGAETLSFYYGPELLQFQGTPIQVSVIGYIDEHEEDMLEEIGMRIWQKGFEKMRAELLTEGEREKES